MATVLAFDRINRLDEDETLKTNLRRRSLPYREFFGDMLLPPEEKEKRIQMAEDLDDVFFFLFAYILSYGNDFTYSFLYQMVEQRYWAALSVYIETDDSGFEPPKVTKASLDRLVESIKDYIARQTRLIVDTTLEHLGDDYYTSEDRATLIAENQINGVENMVEDFEAVDFGYTNKTWVTMLDNRVRDTHTDMEGVTIPILEPFMVGDSLLMFPGDDSLGADASELVNCRCHVEYS